MQKLVVWTLDMQRYALPYAMVERVIRAVEVTPLPDAPQLVRGIINVQGLVIPVINIRTRFHLPEREVALNDQVVLARTARRQVAFFVDGVEGLVDYEESAVVDVGTISPGSGCIAGVLKFPDGMVLIHDLDLLLSLEDEQSLDQALSDVN
jgi:purine-binding chemotaxis protein CheW